MFARTLTVTIARPLAVVSAFLANPENLPRWTFWTAVERGVTPDTWRATSPEGTVELQFVPPNEHGVFDHHVRVSAEVEVYVPLRVVANGDDASEVMLTVFRLPDVTTEAFERDVATVERDLGRLQQLLE